jgi:hypothetical protein
VAGAPTATRAPAITDGSPLCPPPGRRPRSIGQTRSRPIEQAVDGFAAPRRHDHATTGPMATPTSAGTRRPRIRADRGCSRADRRCSRADRGCSRADRGCSRADRGCSRPTADVAVLIADPGTRTRCAAPRRPAGNPKPRRTAWAAAFRRLSHRPGTSPRPMCGTTAPARSPAAGTGSTGRSGSRSRSAGRLLPVRRVAPGATTRGAPGTRVVAHDSGLRNLSSLVIDHVPGCPAAGSASVSSGITDRSRSARAHLASTHQSPSVRPAIGKPRPG